MSEISAQSLLESAWRRSDAVFALLKDDAALYERPIPLRHPLLFYVGHLAAFGWNQLGAGVLGLPPVDEELDRLFERGIDPLDDAELSAVSVDPAVWPTPERTRSYVEEVRRRMLEVLPMLAERREDVLCSGDRVVHVIYEHEAMHHETLIYLLQRMDPSRLVAGDQLPDGLLEPGLPEPGPSAAPSGVPERARIPAGEVTLGACWDSQPFGWDNEFPQARRAVAAFELDVLPVTVARYREFVEETGAEQPLDWFERDGRPWHRTLLGAVTLDDAADWPVYISHDAAVAFAAHHGARLPTEEELQHAAYGTPDGDRRSQPWGEDALTPAHGGFAWNHLGPLPVGSRPAGASAFGIQELVGNGWEWTSSPFRPLPGFEPWIRTYPGYSVDFFDDRHYVVFGGSWATDARLLRRSFRNWYQGAYPYVFAGFRLAWDARAA